MSLICPNGTLVLGFIPDKSPSARPQRNQDTSMDSGSKEVILTLFKKIQILLQTRNIMVAIQTGFAEGCNDSKKNHGGTYSMMKSQAFGPGSLATGRRSFHTHFLPFFVGVNHRVYFEKDTDFELFVHTAHHFLSCNGLCRVDVRSPPSQLVDTFRELVDSITKRSSEYLCNPNVDEM